MEIKKNVLLKEYTTFKIGGTADYFIFVKDKEDLAEAINWAEKKKLPWFILGNGSNVLISDEGFKGLVIKFQNSKALEKSGRILAPAGLSLGELVNFSFKKELEGIEWLSGIPGTVGGAIAGNAGAFGESMADVIAEVEVFDAKEKKTKIFKRSECKFSYRNSVFKKNNNLIIISAIIKTKKGEAKNIGEKIKSYLAERKEKQPGNYPSAGSVFKNSKNKFSLSAGELIEKCGLKGKIIGGAKISEKHANFIVNFKDASFDDVIKLINLAKKEVKKKFNVDLEEEISFPHLTKFPQVKK